MKPTLALPALLADSLIIAGLIVAGLTLASPAPAAADTLVDNVDGFTLDGDGGVERLTGLVIGSDGRIVQVLHRGDKRPSRPDYLVDGKGQILMPGLFDSHVQMSELGFSGLTLDLSAARSLAEAQARIAAYAAAHPDRPWIIGRGWDTERWGLGRLPTAADLDAAVKDRPVWLIAAEGQLGWANSAALAAGGVTLASKDPSGGRIERLAGSQKPSGILAGQATALIEAIAPPPRPVDRDVALANAQEQLLKHGVTAVADMGTTIEEWQAYRRAGDAGTLRVRVVAYARGIDAMTLIAGSAPGPWLYDDRLRMGGVSLDLDGSLASRGAWLKAAYADSPTIGLPRLSGTQLRNLMSRAAMDGFQIAIQASGDAATGTALDAIAELAPTYTGERRWRIEHADLVNAADFARYGAFGVAASMQPARLTRALPIAEARLGPARLAGAHAWNALASGGARLAFGSDAPTSPPDPFAGMAAAITRQDAEGQPFGGWQPQARVTREAALAAYTTQGAWAAFAERRFGRLAPGLRADFVLVDRDPLLASPSDLRAIRVLETWVGGQKVYAANIPPVTSARQEDPAGRRATP
ncbi:MAG: amidohydrolase [Novosphingobium sp.]